MSIIPPTMKAVVVKEKGVIAVEDVPVPTLADDEILVKVAAVAQNPTDWQHVDLVGNPGTILGCDWSGHVVKRGSKVSKFAFADHVAGFAHGGTYTDRGAFAEYVKAPEDLAWKVPSDEISNEESATLGCAFWTAVQALFHPGRLGLVEPPKKVKREEWIFVYGGSTSVGVYAVQLAHVAGYKVVSVASPHNHDLVKNKGADAVFDYKDPQVVEKIKAATKNSLHLALDTISSAETQSLVVRSLADGPGKIIVLQKPEEEAIKLRSDVTIQHTLIYTALGKEFTLGTFYPASNEDRAHIAQFLKKLPDLINAGVVRHNKIKRWQGGLEAIKDGLQFQREGKLSGQKIVYRVG
ncbi:GroES-like protein [Trametopsis cervina]|nr:GroES-like protein [Trametopsis cervina]